MSNKINNITVLSLFDGISCGKIALDRSNIKVNKYFASEIDKYAVAISKFNNPDIIHIGSVTDVKYDNGILYNNTDKYENINIDMQIFGSPCQSFSFAGKRQGISTTLNEEVTTLERYLELKNNGFKFQGESYLFWEAIRLLKCTNPKYYLFENVIMQSKWEDVINNVFRHTPIKLNSSIVSAQNRERLYWTNIPDIILPKNKNISINQILEKDVDKKYFISNTNVYFSDKERNKNNSDKCIQIAKNNQGRIAERIYDTNGKSVTLRSNLCSGGGKTGLYHVNLPKIGAFRGRYKINGKRQDYKQKTAGLTKQELEIRNDEKSNCLTTVQKDNIVVSDYIRRLTPLECERLQTIDDNYTKFGIINNKKVNIPDTQRYKTIGNGWTVEIIKHIFEHINSKTNSNSFF